MFFGSSVPFPRASEASGLEVLPESNWSTLTTELRWCPFVQVDHEISPLEIGAL